MSKTLSLNAYDYSITCTPNYGGRIDSLCYKGIPILRSTLDKDDNDPLQSACFPLVPFSNRIRNGEFTFENSNYKLPSNWDGDQPVIHGEAWQGSWNVIEKPEGNKENHIIMEFLGQDWWPWDYQARQIISISPSGIDIEIQIRNLSDTNMPAGLGFHPYFPRHHDTEMQFKSKKIWPPMDSGRMKPIDDERLGFNNGRNINNINLDHCFEQLDGNIIIKQPSTGLTVTLERLFGTNHAVIYIPEGQTDFFCVEPVSHITGAIGSDSIGQIQTLAPDQTLSLCFRVSASLLSSFAV